MAREIKLDFKISSNLTDVKNDFKDVIKEAENFQKTLEKTPKNVKIKVDFDAKDLSASLKNVKVGLSGLNQQTGQSQQGFEMLTTKIPYLGAALMVVNTVGGILKGTLSTINTVFNTIVESTGKANNELNQVATSFGDLVKPELINRLTGIVQATSLLSKVDFKDTVKGFQAFMNTLGASAQQSAVYIKTFSDLLGENADDAIDWTVEYSSHLRKFGFTAEEAFNAILNTFGSGTYQDKLLDAVKEFGLKINDFSTAEEKVLREAKLFKYVEQIRKGSISGAEGLQQIVGELETLQKAGKDITPLAKALFGAPGEDLGVLVTKLKDFTVLSGELKERVDRIKAANLELVKSQQAVNFEFLRFSTGIGAEFRAISVQIGAAWNMLKATFFAALNVLAKEFEPVLKKISGFFKDITTEGNKSGSVVRQLAGVFIFLGRQIISVAGQLVNYLNVSKGGEGIIAKFAHGLLDLAQAVGILVIRFTGGTMQINSFFKAMYNAWKGSSLLLQGDFAGAGKAYLDSIRGYADAMTDTTEAQINNLRANIALLKTDLDRALDDASGITFDTGDVSGTGAPTGGFTPATSSGSSTASDVKDTFEDRLNIMKRSFEEERKLNDHNLALERIDEEEHAKRLRDIDTREFKYVDGAYRKHYAKRLGLSAETIDKLINDEQAYFEFLETVDAKKYDKVKTFIESLIDAKEVEIASQMQFEQEMLQITIERIEKQKQAELEAINIREEQTIERLNRAGEVAEREEEFELVAMTRRIDRMMEELRQVEQFAEERLKVDNLTAEERVKIEKEASDKVLDVTKKREDAIFALRKATEEKIKSVQSAAGSALGSAGGFDFGGELQRVQKVSKEIDEIQGKGKFDETAATIAKIGLAVGSLAKQFGAVAGVITDNIVAGIDDEIAKQDKVIAKIKEQIAAEKERNNQINIRQEIINTLAQNRVDELEHLRETIPEAEQAQLEDHIGKEKARIKDVDKMREQQARDQEKRLEKEEKQREILEKKKIKVQHAAFEIQRAAKIAEIIAAGAVAAVTALANPATAAVMIALAATSTALGIATVAGQRNPYKLRKGTQWVPGKLDEDGTPALLAGGEAVIPYKTNVMYRDAIDTIFNHKMSPQEMNSRLSGDTTSVVMNVDENGFTKYVETTNEKKIIRDRKMRITKR